VLRVPSFMEKLISLTGSVCFVEFQLPLWLCMMMGPCAFFLHVHDVLLWCLKNSSGPHQEKMVHDYVCVCS
jgi:hypothetical protein